MDKKMLKAAEGTGKAEQASAISKGAVPRRRSSIRMARDILLVWLDKSIDDNNTSCRDTVTQLQRAIGTVNTFTDTDQCVDFFTDNSNAKTVMIISGTLCRKTVPLIHDIDQLDAILVLCKNKTRYEHWTKEWLKIKGVFTEVEPICKALEQAAYKYEQNAISIGFMTTSDIYSKKLDQLDCSFMYTKILKEVLLKIKFEKQHIKKFVDFCRDVFAENTDTMIRISEFEQSYWNKTPIWWYTYEYFLYSMLNRALRLMDVDIIVDMGFFIGDLHRHIEQLYFAQFDGHHPSSSFIVYRGQAVSKTDFEKMKKTNGGLMSFNNFLSTSKDRAVSLAFAESNQSNPDLVGILFVILIDPSILTTPFASITNISYFEDEDEVLFSMHTVFRIRDIKSMSENNRLFQVDLALNSDNDADLRALSDRIREEMEGSTGWYRLGQLLLQMGQFDKAEQIYDVMLQQTTDESEKAPIYFCLGRVKHDQGKYQEAVAFYEKVLEICPKILPPNHPSLAVSYNSIGEVYRKMGENSTALSYFEKALAIWEKSLPPNHPNLAIPYNNIGLVYDTMGKYSTALSYYENALAIWEKSLPPNHPNLAASYGNIGLVYKNVGKYSRALSYYEKDLEISQKSLPRNHPDLAGSYNNIGLVYEAMGEYSKAISCYEKALAIKQQSLPLHHPSLAVSYNNIGSVYSKMGEYSKALWYYEKALTIQQQSLPPNHPHLASSNNNIGVVYSNMGEYSKALWYYEKVLSIQQQSLPPNHPDLAFPYNNIGMVYKYMGDYSKARSFYERALNIAQHSLPENHPDLQVYRNNLESIKKKL